MALTMDTIRRACRQEPDINALVQCLDEAMKNVRNAREHGSVGYLAGWEHQVMLSAASLLSRQI